MQWKNNEIRENYDRLNDILRKIRISLREKIELKSGVVVSLARWDVGERGKASSAERQHTGDRAAAGFASGLPNAALAEPRERHNRSVVIQCLVDSERRHQRSQQTRRFQVVQWRSALRTWSVA